MNRQEQIDMLDRVTERGINKLRCAENNPQVYLKRRAYFEEEGCLKDGLIDAALDGINRIENSTKEMQVQYYEHQIRKVSEENDKLISDGYSDLATLFQEDVDFLKNLLQRVK